MIALVLALALALALALVFALELEFEWFKGNDVNPLSGQDSNALVLTTEEGRFRCFFWVID